MNTRIPTAAGSHRDRCQHGSAVLIFLVLLSVMLVLVAANGHVLNSLQREIRLVEQRQLRHWQRPETNAMSAVVVQPETHRTAP
jgi:hypothetical protein